MHEMDENLFQKQEIRNILSCQKKDVTFKAEIPLSVIGLAFLEEVDLKFHKPEINIKDLEIKFSFILNSIFIKLKVDNQNGKDAEKIFNIFAKSKKNFLKKIEY